MAVSTMNENSLSLATLGAIAEMPNATMVPLLLSVLSMLFAVLQWLGLLRRRCRGVLVSWSGAVVAAHARAPGMLARKLSV